MRTDEAIRKAKGRNNLAKILGITGSAVSQWGETIPELRMYQLRRKKPHWFRAQKVEQNQQVAQAA